LGGFCYSRDAQYDGEMARWLLQLDGDSFDINAFSTVSNKYGVPVISEDGKFYLTGKIFDQFSDPSEVKELGESKIVQLYSVANIIYENIKCPCVTIVWYEDAAGNRKGTALASAQIVGRGNVSVNSMSNDQTKAEKILEILKVDINLKYALEVFATPDTDWANLYRCLEEIEKSGGSSTVDLGFCTKAERQRFTQTANNAETAGLSARHAYGKFESNADPMTLEEAHKFLRALLEKLINTKLTT
jgi:hypothetical protein